MKTNIRTFYSYAHLYEKYLFTYLFTLKKPEEILIEARTAKGWTQTELGANVGLGLRAIQKLEDGEFPKFKTESIEAIDRVLNINLYALIYEKGMHKDSSESEIVIRKPLKPSKKEKEKVQFYDIDLLAGNSPIQFYDDNNMVEIAYEMDIPEFAGCVAFRAYSDSMEPLIKSGSILFGTKIDDWQDHLEYGQIYGVICNNGRRYLKYVRRHENEKTTFILRSENNEMYDDFDIPKKSIKSLWLINGWLNRRT